MSEPVAVCSVCVKIAAVADAAGPIMVRGSGTVHYACGEMMRAMAAAAAPEPSALLAKAEAVPNGEAIVRECIAIAELLLAKNRAYGDAALNPVRIFSRADAVEQLKVRIDDKLSRLARGEAAGEDTELDLIGYLILLRVARRTRVKT